MIWDVVVVGSGIAGLTCARKLSDVGMSVLVLDKGRAVGGRMATRRVVLDTMEISFDHGAQYFSDSDAGFRAMLQQWPDTTAVWTKGASAHHLVGTPAMSSLPSAMSKGLEIHQGVQVTGILHETTHWAITAENMRARARDVVLTVPAPQIAPLLGRDHPLLKLIAPVVMAPCQTLMAAFAAGSPPPLVNRASETDHLAWIACNSSKPDRSTDLVTWVAQASPAWSISNLEADSEEVARQLLLMLCQHIGSSPDKAIHARAHRWRYAHVTTPLGQPFLCHDHLYLGGDWCLGPKVEHAWQSGDAIATDILEQQDAG